MSRRCSRSYPIINWATPRTQHRDADQGVKKVIVEQAQDGDVVLMHDMRLRFGVLAAIDELQSRNG